MLVFISFAYDGSKFNGFQQQKHEKNTVIENFYKALKKLNINQIPIGSGRTDSGPGSYHWPVDVLT